MRNIAIIIVIVIIVILVWTMIESDKKNGPIETFLIPLYIGIIGSLIAAYLFIYLPTPEFPVKVEPTTIAGQPNNSFKKIKTIAFTYNLSEYEENVNIQG